MSIKKITSRDIISISKISILLTGDAFKLRYDRNMGVHTENVNKLLKSVDSWIDKIEPVNKFEEKTEDNVVLQCAQSVVSKKFVAPNNIKLGNYSKIILEPFDPTKNCPNCKYEIFKNSYRVEEKCLIHQPKI
jgi:hypothetical protein